MSVLQVIGVTVFPDGLVSSSVQINSGSFSGSFSGLASTSFIAVLSENRTFAPISGTHNTSIWWIPGAVHNTSFTTVAPTSNTIYFFPLVAPNVGSASIHNIAVYLSAGAGVGDQCSIAFYNGHQEDLHPSTFITASTIDLSTTGIRSCSLQISLKLSPGYVHWLGMHQNNGSTFRAITQNNQLVLGTIDFSTGGTVNCYTSASDWGTGSAYLPAWPVDAQTVDGTPTTITQPIIGLQFGN